METVLQMLEKLIKKSMALEPVAYISYLFDILSIQKKIIYFYTKLY